MKNIISLSIISIIIMSCKCSRVDDDIVKYTQPVEQDVVKVQVQEPKLFPTAGTVKYNYTDAISFDVKYNVFCNEHHPYGYVMIEQIDYKDLKAYDVYMINKKITDYVQYIHKHSEFGVNKGSETITLADKEFCSIFRTSEAVLCTYFDGKEVTAQNVKEAGKRMNGRNEGIIIKETKFSK